MPRSAPTETEEGASVPLSPKRAKFINLAEKRTANAIKAIRVIGKLGNPSAYDYGDEDVKKIVKALSAEIELLKGRLKDTKRPHGVEFKL